MRQSGVTQKTITDFERGATKPYRRTLNTIIAAFEAAGIEFIDGAAPGVRMRAPSQRRRPKAE